MGLFYKNSDCPVAARVLIAGVLFVVCVSPALPQQTPDQTGGFDPLAMRRIPGTVMPSLRGTRDDVGAQPTLLRRQPEPVPADIRVEDNQDVTDTGPIPLSNLAQSRATRAPQVPAGNPQLPAIDPRSRQNDALQQQSSGAAQEEEQEVRQNPRTDRDQNGADPFDEEDPFEATGFRLGTSVINVRLEQSLGYSSNLEQDADGDAGAFSQTNLNVSTVSDWSRHELRIDATGSFRRSFDSEIGDRPAANIASTLRLDLIDGFSSTIGASYDYTTESLTSDNLSDNVNERPGIHTYAASLAIARSQRKLNFSLRGSAERAQFEEASLSDGSALDQIDRNLNTYRVTARVGYDTGAVARPFMEGSVGWRRFDEEIDRNGDRRNSMIYDLRTGVSFDAGEKLGGEIAIGYVREEFEEGTLETLAGYSLNGNIIWSPVRDTRVTLNAETSLNSSTTAGDNGSIGYTAGIDITRQATDRLELNANASVDLDVDEQNDETDVTWSVGLGAQYWMNRYMAISADLDFTRFEDGDGVEDYDDATATLGVVLQR